MGNSYNDFIFIMKRIIFHGSFKACIIKNEIWEQTNKKKEKTMERVTYHLSYIRMYRRIYRFSFRGIGWSILSKKY